MLRRLRTIVIGAFLLGAALPVTLAMTATAASADAVITVTTTNDGGPGSLRQAFADAVANGITDGVDTTIELAPGEYDLTDCTGVFDGGSLLYNAPANNLRIVGHGSTIRQTCPNVSVIIDLSSTGSLAVFGVWLTGATSLASGGGISSTTSGGVTVVDSTISGNSARYGGGGIGANGPVAVINSTITGNSTTGDSSGGGIYIFGGDLTLVYSTVAANAGGFQFEGAVANILMPRGELTSFGSVVTIPSGTTYRNCSIGGPTASHGYNFSDDSSCAFGDTTDRQDAGDPGLLGLDDNGGGTPTMAAPLGGPLVNAIPEAACQADGASGITTDQRGAPRPGEHVSTCPGDVAVLACDIGAFEDQYSVGPSCAAKAPPTPVVESPRFTG